MYTFNIKRVRDEYGVQTSENGMNENETAKNNKSKKSKSEKSKAKKVNIQVLKEEEVSAA